MIRASIMTLSLLGAACATHRDAAALYDFDSVPPASEQHSQLDTRIAIIPVTAPSWLSTPSLIYRLNYTTPARPQAYARSQWSAPPSELLTLRLRELVRGANSGLTTTGLGRSLAGYELEVRLERFEQDFASSSESRCIVTLEATLVSSAGTTLGQRAIEVERPAPTADASGAVRGLVEATDTAAEELIGWLRSTIQEKGVNEAAQDIAPSTSQHR